MVLEYQNYTTRFLLLLLLLHSPDENFVIAEKETFSKIVRLCSVAVVVYFHEYIRFSHLCIRMPFIYTLLVRMRSQENKCRITYASIKTNRKRTENFPIHFARFMLTGVKTFQIWK